MTRGDFVRALASRVDTVRVVRTAINPLLWLDLILTIAALPAGVWIGDAWLRIGFFALDALAVIVTIVAYFVLLFRDPDRLQSEEYRLRQHALRLVRRRGMTPEILDATRDIVRVDELSGERANGGEA